MAIKRIVNRFGYDIRKYHSFYDNVLKRHNIKTVLDIGANTGQFATAIFKNCPTMKIYSFEPLADCYKSLVKNMSSIGKQFQSFNTALGDREEEVWINRSAFSPSSSFLKSSDRLKEAYPKSYASTREKVIIKRLDDITPGLEMEEGILIKMDVQGFEDKVIAGGIKTISEAKLLLIETSFVQLYEKQPLFGDIYDIVGKLGFNYYGNNGAHYDKKTGELLFEDSIFIKKEFLLKK